MILVIWCENGKVYRAYLDFHRHIISVYEDGHLVLLKTGLTTKELKAYMKRVKTFKKVNL